MPQTKIDWITQIKNAPLLDARTFDFEAQPPGGSLTAGVPAVATLAPVPDGVNGTDSGHYLYISGGTGTAEAVLILGGSAVAGAASGTIVFTPANSHSGAWTLQSATSGIQEAINSIGTTTGYADVAFLNTGGGRVYLPAGTYTVYGGPITCGSNIEIFGDAGSTYITAGGPSITLFKPVRKSVFISLHDVIFNHASQASVTAIDLDSVQSSKFRNITQIGGSGVAGTVLYLHASAGVDTNDNCVLNAFDHCRFEIAPAQPVILSGYGNVEGPGVVTMNRFNDLWIAGGAASQGMIDIIKNADTNYFHTVVLQSTTAAYGMRIGDLMPNTSNVGGQIVDNLIIGGTNAAGVGVRIGQTNHTRICNVMNLGWGTTVYRFAGSTYTVLSNVNTINEYEIFSDSGVTFGYLNDGTFIATPRTDVLLVNGDNEDINPGNGSYCRLYGPTGAFAIGGFSGGVEGRILRVFNGSAFAMTIKNSSAGSAVGSKILTLTGADVTLRAGVSFATFVFSGLDNHWILTSTN